MIKIYTHLQVDLDAVVGSCVELYRQSLEPTTETIEFVSADTAVVPIGVIPVDIAARKHGTGDSFVGFYCKEELPPTFFREIMSLVGVASVVGLNLPLFIKKRKER